ncbi:MAG: hypothetical protein LBV54_06225 [Puniceicoccales bacterium]|nr:hypothetical protein [Puniceicoccales bacterium]
MRFLPLFLFALLACIPAVVFAEGAADLKKVEDARKSGNRKAALSLLEPIIAAAIVAQDYDTALAAILEKASTTSDLEYRERDLAVIRVLAAHFESAPPALKSMLAVALANTWQGYYNSNGQHWRPRARSDAQAGTDNFRTRETFAIRAEIQRYYALALADPVALQRIPITSLGLALKHVKGFGAPRSDALRPTLYDYIVYDAITFYSFGRPELTGAEDDFQLAADSPLLGTLEEFLDWKPQAADTNSPLLHAIRLFQDVLRFHQNDASPLALCDADFSRIIWAWRILGRTEDTEAHIDRALFAHIEYWKDCEAASESAAEFAFELRHTASAKAHAIASRGVALHPASAAADRCRTLIAQIEDPELLFLETEFVWNASASEIAVGYRNIERVHFRAIAAEWHEFLMFERSRSGYFSKEVLDEILKKTPVKTWQVTLPKTTDYAVRFQHFTAPAKLPPGPYFIVASVNEKFSIEENTLVHAAVWVSDLTLVFDYDSVNAANPNDNIHGHVLNAITGEPVPGASISGWYLDNTSKREKSQPVKTDATGAFSFRTPFYDRNLLLVESPDGHKISTVTHRETEYGRVYPRQENMKNGYLRGSMYARLFTDRSIYRPGQSIQFKAVLFTADERANKYATLDRREITVVLNGPANKEVARQKLRTNGYGTVTGSFTVPPGRLNGAYTLYVQSNEGWGRHSSARIYIEEYKRPKFEVLLGTPVSPPKLDAAATLTGTAVAYTGAPVDGAKVKWSVKRIVHWPSWCWWFAPRPERLIARGTTVTDATGKFTVEFTAETEKITKPEDEPRFDYEVTAEVTDSTGETREAMRRVTVGYTALQAGIAVAAWQTPDAPVALKLTVASLTGEPQKATGQLTIYALRQPGKIIRPKLKPSKHTESNERSNAEDPADPRTWKEGESVATKTFTTDTTGAATIFAKLPVGIYRAILSTSDAFGQPVSARTEITVADPAATHAAVRVPFSFVVAKDEFQPGDTFTALWSSGYNTARAFVSIEHRGKIIRRFWTDPARTQQKITFPVTEELRGGFTVHIFQVRENHFYARDEIIRVPWKNKELDFIWERFNSKLIPGERETWTLRIQGKGKSTVPPLPVELAATLYDASLDQFALHSWGDIQDIFYRENYCYRNYFAGEWRIGVRQTDNLVNSAGRVLPPRGSYRRWPAFIDRRSYGVGFGGGSSSADTEPVRIRANAADNPPDLDTISARKNFSESAFFFPAIISGADGTVRFEFTAPEVLTRWKLLVFAHDKQLRSGVLTDATIVTAKGFMVQPNAPRFVREGDVIEFPVKLTNKTDAPQTGRVRLSFTDALSLASADARLGNATPECAFTLAPRSSQTLSWRVCIPDGQGYLIYKAVATAGRVSDGEESFLPVLSRRPLITESLTFSAPGSTGLRPASNSESETRAPSVTRTIPFPSLLASAADPTLRHESLTVQMFSNPAWAAVMALPYLMEFPHECNEQLFSRYYANALARHIVNANPKLARVVAQWKDMPAPESAFFKNGDLKSILIAETPWLRAAEGESAQRREIGLLFEKNSTDAELNAALKKLSGRQLPDGAWGWFPGGSANDFITRHIVAGFGKLARLGVVVDRKSVERALPRLDAWLAAELVRIKAEATKHGKNYKEENAITPMYAFHLYARSFFPETPVAAGHVEAYAYFTAQAVANWQKLPLQSQAHVALALHRTGSAGLRPVPGTILRSLRERAKSAPGQVTFWPENASSRAWYWYQAPIETHALFIEAFSEIAPEPAFLNELQTWLLKQKQARFWPTTKSNTEAVYALLLRGTEQFAFDAPVDIKLGTHSIVPQNVEAGTGFYSERLPGSAVRPDMGNITVSKATPGIAWGSVTWQYFQDIEKITSNTATPLKLKKTLWKQVLTKSGKALVSVSQSKVNPGDTLIVRLELSTDRAMEFVHLKDQRASGTEPVNVLSGRRRSRNLEYYVSVKDTATHFFIDWLPAGTHVLEYPVRVQLRGVYPSGIAEIQSMYAPELNAHSESIPLVVE